jgi:hypothetical protein
MCSGGLQKGRGRGLNRNVRDSFRSSQLLLTMGPNSVRSSTDTGSRSAATRTGSVVHVPAAQETEVEPKIKIPGLLEPSSAQLTATRPPPITVTPATPADADLRFPNTANTQEKIKRSLSMDRDPSAGKRVQQMLKNRVHKGQEKISTISKKIGHGVVKNGSLHLRRTTSAPGMYSNNVDFRVSWSID